MSSTHLISGTQQPHGTLEEAVFQQPSTYEHELVGFQMCAWNSLASPSYSVGGSSQWIWGIYHEGTSSPRGEAMSPFAFVSAKR